MKIGKLAIKPSSLRTGLATLIGTKKTEILSGLAVVGALGSTYLTVTGTIKAVRIYDELKENHEEKPTKEKIIKATWKCYIPTGISIASTISSIVMASYLNHRRFSALAAAYSLAQSSAKEYKDKVVEVLGHDQEEAIRKSLNQDNLPSLKENQIYRTKSGETLCYDPWSGRYFRSDKNELDRICNVLNLVLLRQDFVYLNDFYDELGGNMDRTKPGGDYGWRIDKCGIVELKSTTNIADNGEPCIVLDFAQEPMYEP